MKKLLLSIVTTILVLGATVLPNISFAQTQTNSIKNLGIYYGYPSAVNGANGSVTKAIETFKPYDVLVLGDKLEHLNHGDHNKTQQIINGLKPTGNKIFGYIPIGVTGSADSLSNTTLKTYIDEWSKMDVYGIFMDEYGFDYGVTRARQNDLVQYAHSKGLSVFANSWVAKDAMGDLNEKGTVEKAKLDNRDYFLMESWIAESGKLQTAKQWVAKGDETLALSKQTGVKVGVLATVKDPKTANENDIKFKIASYASAMYGFDSFQWTDDNYSASNNYLNHYTLPQNYGTYFTEDVVTHSSDYTKMTRKTEKGEFVITQNASTTSAAYTTTNPTPDPVPTDPTPTQPPTDNATQKQIDALKVENANLKADNDSLKTKITTLTNDNNILKSTNASLNEKITKAKDALNN